MIEIGKMSEGDTAKAAAMEQKIFSDPWSAESFAQTLDNPNAVMLAAYDDGQLAGYCCMYKVLDEGEIVNVAVAPQFRRKGIAHAMLDVILGDGYSKDLACIFLEVRERNLPAQELYKKMGFEFIGRRKNFYEKPVEDALVMRLSRQNKGMVDSL